MTCELALPNVSFSEGGEGCGGGSVLSRVSFTECEGERRYVAQDLEAELLALSEQLEASLAATRTQDAVAHEAGWAYKYLLARRNVLRVARMHRASALRGWRELVRGRGAQAMVAEKAMARRDCRVRRRCVDVWCEHVAMRRNLVQRISRRIADERLRSLSWGLVHWRGNALKEKAMRSRALHVVRRWQMRTVSCALSAWCHFTTEGSRVRTVLRRVVMRMTLRDVSMAFECWSEATAEGVLERDKRRQSDGATATLEAERVASIQAKARLEEECERVQELQRELVSAQAQREADRQQSEEGERARRLLELQVQEQQGLLRQVQDEREQLRLSQDALKTDSDAMREEVQTFMAQERLQEQQRERALEVEVQALELVAMRLGDCVAQGRGGAEDFCRASAAERSRMMEKLARFMESQQQQQQQQAQLQRELRTAKENLSAALEKVEETQSRYEVTRAEMESDAMTRAQDAEVIKDLRVRLESTGAELKQCQEDLHAARHRADDVHAQQALQSAEAQQVLSSRESELESMRREVEELRRAQQEARAEMQGLEETLAAAREKKREHEDTIDSLRAELEVRGKRAQETARDLEEVRVNLRAAEERAAEIEAKLPAALEEAARMQEERGKHVRQLELVGERVIELEALCDRQAEEMARLEAAQVSVACGPFRSPCSSARVLHCFGKESDSMARSRAGGSQERPGAAGGGGSAIRRAHVGGPRRGAAGVGDTASHGARQC